MFAVTFVIAACTSQDDIYKEFVVNGGRVYPAKAVNVSYIAGYQRVTISWEKPRDPAVVGSKLFWNNRADSAEVVYSLSGKADYTVTGLEDRSYTFYIVNYDKNGNKSLDYEITANPYGSSWLASHSERSVSATFDGDSTVLIFGKATYEMVSTRIAYMNTAGKVVECPQVLLSDVNTIVLKDAMRGKKFLLKSTYKPDNGIDAVENVSWSKSSMGSIYKLDVSGWTTKVTENQTRGSFTADKIFDGLTESGSGRFMSSNDDRYSNIFPKIIAVDTNSPLGMEPTILSVDVYQHPFDGSYRFIRDISFYIGNTAFDPDCKDFANEYVGLSFKRTLSTAQAVQTLPLSSVNTGRYFAMVFTNSYNVAAYFIDLWELAPYGYIEGDSDVPYPDFK